MVIICPDCGFENIDGMDACESCQQSLTMLNRPRRPYSPIAQNMVQDRVDSLDPKQPVAVTSTTSVGEVLKIMLEKRIGCMLVADKGKLEGIFSDRDAVMRLGTEFSACRSRPIAEFMTPLPGTLEMRDKIIFAVQKMAIGGYRHIPILAGEQLVGVISIRDILRYTSEKLEVLDAAGG